MSKRIIALAVSLLLILPSAAFAAATNSGPALYLDVWSVTQKTAIGKTFDVSVKTVNALRGSGIFSYKLLLGFEEEYIKAVSVKGGGETGITGPVLLDNNDGAIEFWYGISGEASADYIVATVTFEVLSSGSPEISINGYSEFYRADGRELEVNYGDGDGKLAKAEVYVGDTHIPKPIFEYDGGSKTFYSSLKVGFKKRTDGAEIYYTTTDGGNPTRLYDPKDPIVLTRTRTIKAVAKIGGYYSEETSMTFNRVSDSGSSGGSGGSGGGNGTITIPPPAPPTPTQPEARYHDIDGHWSKNFFESLIEKGVINGYEDGTVRPDNQVTRAEAAKIIVAALGEVPSEAVSLPFEDAESIADWAGGYVQKAVELGIITGYEDNTFQPAQNVSRKELVVLAVRAFQLSAEVGAGLSFADNDAIPAWAADSVETALTLGVVSGYEDNTFKPDNFVSRGETSKIIALCLEIANPN
ncbi:MAG: S-layer homology domain-containing protein [Clostridiales bacterium]|jgi:hypothetical protein|nr:S-layer homology domain-containing protein [Clostridiales bacterium]